MQQEKVFVVQHLHTRPGGIEDVKLMGVYRTADAAKAAVGRLTKMPGFIDHPRIVQTGAGGEEDGFHMSAYLLDEDHWSEGFVTL